MKLFFKIILGSVVLLISIVFFGWLYYQYKLKNIKDTHNLETIIDSKTNNLIDKKKCVGLAVGIYKKGEIYTNGYGKADIKGNVNVDDSTIFEIGSISKVFTTELVELTQEKYGINWNENILKYYPKDYKLPKDDATTLLHLATHTSGFPRVPDTLLNKMTDECNPYASLTIDDLKFYLQNPTDKKKPNIKESDYSNLGNGLLGHILEWKSGKSYETLLQEEICTKYGMINTTTTNKHKNILASPYDEKREKVCHWDLPILFGAGVIKSNIIDMMRFAKANLEDKTLQQTHIPVYNTNGGEVCKGWFVDNFSKKIFDCGKIIWHNGGTGGFSTYIGLVPERNIAIVILANQAEVNYDIEKLAHELLMFTSKVSFAKK